MNDETCLEAAIQPRIADFEVKMQSARDGDLIVLTTDKVLSSAQRMALQRGLAAIIDELGVKAKGIVIDQGMKIEVVRTSDLEKSHGS